MESRRRTVIFVFWLTLFTKACLSMTELTAQEGKEFTLICSGNSTRRLRHIWWISNSRLLSKCYVGKDDCINNEALQFTAKNHHKHKKFTSSLTIYNVTSSYRDQVFKCTDDDGDILTEREFIIRVYHVPESPVCRAEELPRGRIKVTCETPKVFPTIICEIAQEFYTITAMIGLNGSNSNVESTPDIIYNTRNFKDGTTNYNSATCSAIICTRQPGLYRFKVKMYPNITNSLVVSVDGYTNTVTMQSVSSDEICRERDNVDTINKSGSVETTNTTKLVHPEVPEPLVGEKSSRYKEGQTMNREMENSQLESVCESAQGIIRMQLTVILVLACLLLISVLLSAIPLIQVRCRVAKKPQQDYD